MDSRLIVDGWRLVVDVRLQENVIRWNLLKLMPKRSLTSLKPLRMSRTRRRSQWLRQSMDQRNRSVSSALNVITVLRVRAI